MYPQTDQNISLPNTTNVKSMKTWDLVTDYQRYIHEEPSLGFFNLIMLQQGFWAIVDYRISRALNFHLRPRIVSKIINKTKITTIPSKITQIITNIELPKSAKIGKGVFIPHFGPIIINHRAIIGDYCTIHPGVIIGAAGRGDKQGVPKIGNRVYIGSHALILGNIEIGDDVAIGAGAVVTKSLPARSVVVGNPARIISYSGSFDLIKYPGMDTDKDRGLSLAELEKSEVNNINAS
jgi:serine O-acetyltransferase